MSEDQFSAQDVPEQTRPIAALKITQTFRTDMGKFIVIPTEDERDNLPVVDIGYSGAGDTIVDAMLALVDTLPAGYDWEFRVVPGSTITLDE